MDALHRNKHSVLRLFSLTACLISTAAASPAMITGVTAIEAVATYAPAAYLFLKRDECPRDTFQCDPSLGAVFSDICCQNGQTCAFDASDNPACCPSGVVCTGTAPATAPAAGSTAPVSFVPNSYYSFPFAQTTFDDRGACSSAVKDCSRNYDACVTDLQGDDGYAVTIDVPGGGGTTVDGSAVGLDAASATSICSSLSTEACSDLEATSCSSYDSGARPAALHTLPTSLTALVVVASFATAMFRGLP